MPASPSVSAKLVGVIAVVSVAATLAAAWIVVRGAERTIREQAIVMLDAERASRARLVTAYFEQVHKELLVAPKLLVTQIALREMPPAILALPRQVRDASVRVEGLRRFYDTEIRRRQADAGIEWQGADRYLRLPEPERLLQSLFLAENPHPIGEKIQRLESGASTDYDRLHALFHPVARGKLEAFVYHDVFLVAVDGTVLYSCVKEIDFATNLRTGPFRDSGLAGAFARAVAAPEGSVHFVDFAPYEPSFGSPAAFVATPVFDSVSHARLGVFAYQLAPDEIDAIMTDVGGFGDSGETYLVGSDVRLRTNRRGGHLSPLRQSAETEAVRRALAGETATIEQQNDRGVRVLSSFAPVSFEGVHWALLAEANLADALAPARRLRSQLVVLLMAVGLVSAFVLWQAMRRIVLRPVAALAAGARRVAAHDYTRPVSLKSRDELGLLGRSFDGMMASVGAQVEDLRRAQKDLEKSEERLAAAATGANLGLWNVEPQHGETMTNAIFESQLGYPPLTLRESNEKWAPLRGGLAGWVELLHPDDRPGVEEQIRRNIAGEMEVYQAEHRVRTGDGSYKWILSIGRAAERDEAGRPLRVNGVHIDISRMKDLQLDLQLRYEELQHLQQLRDGLVHMIVHDLRSPLTSVMGYIDMLRTETAASPDERAMYVDEAYTGALQMVEMVSSLLDVNRLEAGEMPVDRQETDLCRLAAEAVRSLGSLTIDRNVTQAAPDGRVSCRCDAGLTRRVIGNLLANALKFTPETGAIGVTVSRVNGLARVEVADTGPGIPADFIGRVFDKFSQAGAGRAQKRYSTGLGLTFCKLAVEAHGGTIGVTSEPGVGSRFWFQLPVGPDTAA